MISNIIRSHRPITTGSSIVEFLEDSSDFGQIMHSLVSLYLMLRLLPCIKLEDNI